MVPIFPTASPQIVKDKETPSCELAPISNNYKSDQVIIINDKEKLNNRALPYYGYCTWDPNNTLIPGPVKFNPSSPENITQIKWSISIGFISGGTWAVGKWYGCEYAFGNGEPLIWTINPVVGDMTQVGSYDPEGTGLLSFNGLAYDPTDDIMYGCNSSSLFTVDMNNGSSNWIGNFGISKGIMIAIAFDNSGNLFGIELITDSLYSIDPTTGIASQIGSGLGININYAQDMAFDFDTGILYLSAYTVTPETEGALYTCDTNTGVATKVGTFQGGAEITALAIPYCANLKIIPSSIKGGVLKIGRSKIRFTIKNIGGLPCTDISLSLSSMRGFIFILDDLPIISELPPGDTFNITSPTLIGIGFFPKITITATETSCGSTDTQTKKARIIGLLWSY